MGIFDDDKKKNAMSGFPDAPTFQPAPNIFNPAPPRASIPIQSNPTGGGYGAVLNPNAQRFSGSGMASMDGTAPPIAGGTTYHNPGGGAVTLPSTAPVPATSLEGRGLPLPLGPNATQAETIKHKMLTEDALARERLDSMDATHLAEDRQARILNESKAGFGARQIIKSLKEAGMGEDEIKKEIGLTPTTQMSKVEGFRKLRELASRKAEGGEGGGTQADQNRARRMERILQRADFKNGVPSNAPGRAIVLDTFYNDTGPDPLSDKTNREYMNDKDKREYDRYMGQVAFGRPDKDLEKRVQTTSEKIQKKREVEYEKRQAGDIQSQLDIKIQNAANKEEDMWWNEKKDQLNVLLRKKKNAEGNPALFTETDQLALDAIDAALLRGYPGSRALQEGVTGGTDMSGADQQALDWANKNPDDPRSAQIKAKLGVQ